jgi:aryl-alcohol dehydrogenase-like predicted oxidoreductase
MNAYCNHAGIGIIPYAPLSDGNLARPLGDGASARQLSTKGSPFERKFAENEQTIIKRVEELAKKKGVTMAQVALAWVQTKCTSPIVGINKVSFIPAYRG